MNRIIAICLGAAIGVAAAVGIADNAAAADAPKCGLNNGKAASGEPIQLGSIVSKTGPDDFSAAAQAATAYFKCVNANGGINGRPVVFTVADDAWSPEQTAQVATKLVKDQKVLALVADTSIVDCSVNEGLYEKEDILVIAGVGVSHECFFNKNYAPTNQGPRLSNLSPQIYLSKQGPVKRIVCIAANLPGSDWGCNGIADWGKTKGIEVKTILFNPGAPDATSTMLQAMSFNPDVIDLLMLKAFAVPMFAAAEEQGLGDKVKWSGAASLYNASIPEAIGPYWAGKLHVGLEFQPSENGGPDNLNWLAVMNKYGNASDPRDTFSQAGYLAARIVTEALLKLDPAKIDRPAVTAALRGVKGFKSDILCSPWYFGPGSHHNANHAGVVTQVVKGGYKVVEGCVNVDDPELSDLKKLETDNHLVD